MRAIRTTRRTRAAAVLALLLAALAGAAPADADDEDEAKPPRLRSVSIAGNEAFGDRRLKREMNLRSRPWYEFWRRRPRITEEELRTDVARIERFYLARGFYQTDARYELERDAEKDLVDVRLEIVETQQVEVRDLRVVVAGEQQSDDAVAALAVLPIAEGDPFDEEPYRAAEETLRDHFLARGHARVRVRRSAVVDVHTRNARVVYEVEPGPVCVFGRIEVEGNDKVARYIIEREIQIEPGDRFDPEALARARGRIFDLGLFGVVRVVIADPDSTAEVVDLRVLVEERPPRSVSLGVGYGTDDRFRIQATWAHRNFLGDGRRLAARAKYSSLIAAGGVELMQPHFFAARNRLILEASHDQLDEASYTVNESRFRPRLERTIGADLTLAVAWRLAWVETSQVDAATAAELDLRPRGLISGPALSFVYNDTDDELDPRRGSVAAAGVRYSDTFLGADFDYIGLWAEGRHYVPLPLGLVVAVRAAVATTDPLGADNEVPIHERLYSGGDGSIRGFGRFRLGPRSSNDDPLGGLSRVEGTFELRRRIWGGVGGAAFVEAGDVALDPWDFRFAGIEPSAGVGLTYATPVGPLRLDVGFPFDPPPNDESWRVHFSVGQYF